jgi:hypothetical protein
VLISSFLSIFSMIWGLQSACSQSISEGRQVFPWIDVGCRQNLSFAEVLKKPASVFTSANGVPVGQLGGIASTTKKRNKNNSVFDRLVLPRVSVFDRISWRI